MSEVTPKLLAGKVAIVSAAGQGVGRGVAIALARAGASVVASGRTVSKCESVVGEITALGAEAIAVECDVTVDGHIARCVERALDAYGGIDVLVNAADDQRLVPFLEITDDDMLANFRTGALGTVKFTQAVVPHLQARGGGAIVNVASGAGLLAMPGMGPYSAVKEGIRSLTRTAAVELGPLGIRVNVICPTAWAPSFEEWAAHDPAEFEALIARTPLGRIGDPVDDVGEGVVFLCSDQSRYVTGTTLMLDGGNTYLR
jgi:NAD(P)-dependent dehydrogenase (short-subunit alcohol dehydrogenase family)